MPRKSGFISTIVLMFGFLLILGPIYLFPVCQPKGMMLELKSGGLVPMKCSYAASAETAMGVLVIALALLLFVARQKESRYLLYLLLLVMGGLVIFIPTWLIGVCSSPTMPCRAGTLPFWQLTGGLLMAIGLFGLVSER